MKFIIGDKIRLKNQQCLNAVCLSNNMIGVYGIIEDIGSTHDYEAKDGRVYYIKFYEDHKRRILPPMSCNESGLQKVFVYVDSLEKIEAQMSIL